MNNMKLIKKLKDKLAIESPRLRAAKGPSQFFMDALWEGFYGSKRKRKKRCAKKYPWDLPIGWPETFDINDRIGDDAPSAFYREPQIRLTNSKESQKGE